MKKTTLFVFIQLIINLLLNGETPYWHGIKRQIRYIPGNECIYIVNGNKKFNRALYGTNTAFRIEAGDLPEFALYMPGMGGNIKLGIININKGVSKWFSEFDSIKSIYKPGAMEYKLKDFVIGNGLIKVEIVAMAESEGCIIKVNGQNIEDNLNLIFAYGGVSLKKFPRNGDIGAEPESVFYMLPEYCKDNEFEIEGNQFRTFLKNGKERKLVSYGIVPEGSSIKISDITAKSSPQDFINKDKGLYPVLIAVSTLNKTKDFYFLIASKEIKAVSFKEEYEKAIEKIKRIKSKFSINTPDPFINNLDWTLLFASDAIWEDPSFLHGAVAWRMRYNGWRGAYAGDFLGWHDRARMHFESYSKSQYTEPDSGISMPDPDKNFARQKEIPGVAPFIMGYISRYPGNISRPSHYDMNQIFVDQLLYHFQWTGDWDFIKKMWPLIEKHLKWEKKNFDCDGDGLYDSYASFWASDAIYYAGGGVTHSSAMNYKANKIASIIAKKIGKDYKKYQEEAEKIKKAINTKLWLKYKGHYGEFRDLLGERLVHPSAGLWTIYHSIESGIGNKFQNYLNTKYVDNEIPHIPVNATGLKENYGYYLLSTTNWMPYTWSVNNVAMAENVHMALAFWKSYRFEEGFRLFKSSIVESGYLGSSPGNFQQLSFYDAFRGELYRDFADPIGITARTLVEGLFGVMPESLVDTLIIIPGFPAYWDSASIFHPSICYTYSKIGSITNIKIRQSFKNKLALKLILRSDRESIKSITVNGKDVDCEILKKVGFPFIKIVFPYQKEYDIKIEWIGDTLDKPCYDSTISEIDTLCIGIEGAKFIDFYDPLSSTEWVSFNEKNIKVKFKDSGNKTIFVLMKQGIMEWWEPIDIRVTKPIEIMYKEVSNDELRIVIKNNSKKKIKADFVLCGDRKYTCKNLLFEPNSRSDTIAVPVKFLMPGTNKLIIKSKRFTVEDFIINWDIYLNKKNKIRIIKLEKYYNAKLAKIFKKQYYSPRPDCPTLQIPVQGIGDWCSYAFCPKIDDSGLRKIAGEDNLIEIWNGIKFHFISDSTKDNVLFVSKWDNYPDSVYIPLNIKAKHMYLLMAGSTNHMQSRFINGEIGIIYKNEEKEVIELKNPETWWPIEQDYYNDGFAFNVGYPHPLRIYLKTGDITNSYYNVLLKNKTKLIDGGASMVIDVPLTNNKKIRGIYIKAIANEVVIGLLSLTLVK